MIEGIKCPECERDKVEHLIYGNFCDYENYQCEECKHIFPIIEKKEDKEIKGEDNMNITIEQIIETLKDENKRKKIEEIICDGNNWTINSNYYIDAGMFAEKFNKKDIPTFRSLNGFNRFETESECDKMARKLNAELKLYHISKHLNKGWTIKDGETYSILEYNKYSCEHHMTEIREREEYSLIKFKSKDMLPEIIRLMGEQSLKDYFMIED
jgi:hypothetical protein